MMEAFCLIPVPLLCLLLFLLPSVTVHIVVTTHDQLCTLCCAAPTPALEEPVKPSPAPSLAMPPAWTSLCFCLFSHLQSHILRAP